MKIVRFSTLAALAVLLHPILHAELYRNDEAGFSIEKPKEWHFLDTQDKSAAAPMVGFTKHPNPFNDVNPTVKVNLHPLNDLDGNDPARIAALLAGPMQQAFDNFEVKGGPTQMTISGYKTGYIRVSYSMPDPAGNPIGISSELWVIPKGKHFFLIGTAIRQDQRTGTQQEIHNIVDTIKIDPPKPGAPGSRQAAIGQAIQNNLKLYVSAARAYMQQTGSKQAAYDDLVGKDKMIVTLPSVNGESYQDLVIKTWTREIFVVDAEGIVHTYQLE